MIEIRAEVTEWPKLKITFISEDGQTHEAFLVGNLHWQYTKEDVVPLATRINEYNDLKAAVARYKANGNKYVAK